MAEPGWYPQDNGTQRYWDGSAWTDHFSPAPAGEAVSTTVAGQPRWWTRKPAIGIGGIALGLIVGAALAGGSADTTALDAKINTLSEQRSDLKDQVVQLKDSAVDQATIDEKIATAVDDAVTEAQTKAESAQKQAVAAAVAKERQRTKRLVADAKAAAAPPPAQEPAADEGGDTDPRFRTCGEANDNGYGPYREGVDPEYDWYQDRDGDGVVCES